MTTIGAADGARGPIDAVFTWVDDRFPGYAEQLRRYGRGGPDLNPNRTRDNLEILKYNFRALEMFAPWIRQVYLVSCSPQVPGWLAASPRLKLVHHDAFMDEAVLPTFNSFAIQSYLNRLPGLSRRFIMFDDDVLLAAPVTPAHFLDRASKLRVFHRLGHTPDAAQRHSGAISPWNASLAHTNHLLDRAYGAARRPTFTHAPLFVDRDWWEEMIAKWPEDFALTRSSRFRALYNVVPDYLYPHFLLATGRGTSVSPLRTYREARYHGIENSVPWTRLGLAAATMLGPSSIGLNDGFGDDPNPAVVALVRRFLERRYPVKSPFEI
jgi:hypothetical protein